MKPARSLLKPGLWLLLFVAGPFAASAQDPYLGRSTETTGNLRIVTEGAGILPYNAASGREKGLYTIWLETGDGNYISSFDATVANNIPVPMFNMPPFMLSTKLYDRRRPPSTSSSVTVSAVNTVGSISSPMLGGRLLALFSSAREMVAGDTMVFGLSYAAYDTAGTYKLVFRYNRSQGSFIPVKNATDAYRVTDYTAGNTPVSIPCVRMFNNEKMTVDTDLGRYRNAVVFNSIQPSAGSHNLFVSLVPSDIGMVSDDLEAVLYYLPNGEKKWKVADSVALTNMQSAQSHDPNNLHVSPTCLPLPQTAGTLHYTINFQNTGMGDADKVIAVFNVPEQMNRSQDIATVQLTFAGKPARLLVKGTDYQMDGDRIVFTINDTLLGCTGLPDPVTNPKTMGSISFDLAILPGNNPQQPAILQAWTEIYFHSIDPARERGMWPACRITDAMVDEGLFMKAAAGFEMPIRTGNAITAFSRCCGDTPTCSCAHPKHFRQWLQCHWWLWMIAAGLLLLVVIWLLYKRRRRRH